jgi:hypothetical protein
MSHWSYHDNYKRLRFEIVKYRQQKTLGKVFLVRVKKRMDQIEIFLKKYKIKPHFFHSILQKFIQNLPLDEYL